MLEEQPTKNNHDVQIAVLGEKVGAMGGRIEELGKTISDRFGELSSFVQKFIEVSDKKLDKEIYLENQKHTHRMHEQFDRRIGALENDKENNRVASDARNGERDKIFGIGKGTLTVLIQLLTFISLMIGLASISQ